MSSSSDVELAAAIETSCAAGCCSTGYGVADGPTPICLASLSTIIDSRRVLLVTTSETAPRTDGFGLAVSLRLRCTADAPGVYTGTS